MQTNRLPVYDMDIFDHANNFWIHSMYGLLQKHPQLEDPHECTFYSFLIIEKGSGQLIIDNVKYLIDDSQVIIIKPNCIAEIDLNTEACGTIICFTEDFFSVRYNNNILHQFTFFNSISNSQILLSAAQLADLNALVAFVYKEFTNQKKVSINALRSYLNILLIELERAHSPLKTTTIINPAWEKVQKFQRLIDQHFKTVKMPSDYAEMLNLSTNYLNKICKKTLGQTSGDLIRKQIILEAQRLLHYTNLSVNEIASQLGFDHSSYFVTLFKKETHQTPEQYRKQRNEE